VYAVQARQSPPAGIETEVIPPDSATIAEQNEPGIAFLNKRSEMSQFLVVHFKIAAKGSLARPTGNETVAVELPVKHVADWKLERPHLKLSDEEIGIELAQAVAIAAARKFLPLTNSPLKAREVHSPRFLPRRLPIMNERGCDYEDNGIRAWFITEAPA